MVFLLLGSATAWGQVKTLFYMSNGVASVHSFIEHKDKIDIISPTWYQVDQSGLVTGELQPDVLRAAKLAHVSVVPIFALFDKDKVHTLLLDEKAQDEMKERIRIMELKADGTGFLRAMEAQRRKNAHPFPCWRRRRMTLTLTVIRNFFLIFAWTPMPARTMIALQFCRNRNSKIPCGPLSTQQSKPSVQYFRGRWKMLLSCVSCGENQAQMIHCED